MKEYYTCDNVEIVPGLRVFTNDCEWGTISDRESRSYGEGDVPLKDRATFDGWFTVCMDSGWQRLYNGDRMRTTSI